MRFADRRRSFPGRAGGRGLRPFGTGWPPRGDGQSGSGQIAGRCVSLALATGLVGALLYALLKFFEMAHAVRTDARDLWFVPVVISAVLLLVVFRVVRPLLREILKKTSRK